MIGEEFLLFDTIPDLSIVSTTYCQLGAINRNDFRHMLSQYPEMKEQMINKILDSPFDEERDFFI